MNTEDLIQHFTYQQSEIIETTNELTLKQPLKIKEEDDFTDKYKNSKKIRVHMFAHKEKVKCSKKCMIREETYKNNHKVIKLK
jgi:hypothetical protein